MAKEKLPSISKIKKALFADWALRVKQRDGFKCLVCGSKELLTSHHWHICDHNAHAARYCVDNGATLCYTCHIRGVHQRADHFSTSRIYDALNKSYQCDECNRAISLSAIEALAKVEVTTALLRALYDELRKRVVCFKTLARLTKTGKKWFLTTPAGVPQRAVAGNVVEFCALRYEVTAVSTVEDENGGKCWRYAAKLTEEQ